MRLKHKNYHVFITAMWTLEGRKLVLAIVAGT